LTCSFQFFWYVWISTFTFQKHKRFSLSQHALYINAIPILWKKWNCFLKCGNILTTLCIRRNGIMNTHKSTLEMAVVILVFCNLSLIYEVLVAPCFFVIVHWSCFLFAFFFLTSHFEPVIH
jgi:hypothetical protein